MILLGLDSEILKLKEHKMKPWIKFVWVRFHEKGTTLRIA